jgi:hypothetical protein
MRLRLWRVFGFFLGDLRLQFFSEWCPSTVWCANFFLMKEEKRGFPLPFFLSYEFYDV